jgi:indole-3-glycerol phosphate synthase
MSVLEKILAYKREEVEARKARRPWGQIEDEAFSQPPARDFVGALLARTERPALIAEIKKASPSKGVIRADFDPPSHARAYEAGGATCLSVLTDGPSFQGADDCLPAARNACTLPVLRKDFVIDAWQVFESRALGADAILIIMAAVSDEVAADIYDAACECEMASLVEVHDERELARALALGAPLIGVNNRSLTTFATDLATTERLAQHLPADRVLVAESGITTPADIARLQMVGARAFLVGESLMRQADIAAATRSLLTMT